MNDMLPEALAGGLFGLILGFLCILWVILWILVPFMIHSIQSSNKKILTQLSKKTSSDELVHQLIYTNELLKHCNEQTFNKLDQIAAMLQSDKHGFQKPPPTDD
ncbi:MAG: hypothetical protein P9M14_00650 [Candidatus Alcyoniella australis]|nr:hypothetical protein [Candidatus Alcyoniella australis]